MFKVKEALKRMDNEKVVGHNKIPIKVWKCIEDKGIGWHNMV